MTTRLRPETPEYADHLARGAERLIADIESVDRKVRIVRPSLIVLAAIVATWCVIVWWIGD